MGSKRRRYVCHHEAGHVLVRWYFGHSTEKVVVLTIAEVRAGKQIIDSQGQESDCEGLVLVGYNISDAIAAFTYPYLPEAVQRFAICRRDVRLIELAAGIAAEAAYRRASPGACGLEGGGLDFEHARALTDAWFEDPSAIREAMLLAELRATALVRSTLGAAAIKAIADALMQHGEISGDEIERLCSEAYGGRQPGHDSWADHWPPSLADLRSGVVYEREPQPE